MACKIGEPVPVDGGVIIDWQNSTIWRDRPRRLPYLPTATVLCDGNRIDFVEVCRTGKKGWAVYLKRDPQGRFLARGKVYGEVEVEFR